MRSFFFYTMDGFFRILKKTSFHLLCTRLYITVLKKPKLGLGLMKFLKNYENIQNWNFLKTLIKRISQKVYKTYHAQKRPEICTCCRVSKAKFYLYHSTNIAEARPGFDDWPEHPFVQINSSSPWTGQWIKGMYRTFSNHFNWKHFVNCYLIAFQKIL